MKQLTFQKSPLTFALWMNLISNFRPSQIQFNSSNSSGQKWAKNLASLSVWTSKSFTVQTRSTATESILCFPASLTLFLPSLSPSQIFNFSMLPLHDGGESLILAHNKERLCVISSHPPKTISIICVHVNQGSRTMQSNHASMLWSPFLLHIGYCSQSHHRLVFHEIH